MLIALLLAAAPPEAPVSEEAACQRVTRAAAETNPRLPAMLDPVTRLDEIQSDCAAKTYVMFKTIIRGLNDINPGWQERQQQELDGLVCETSLRGLERIGWRFIEKLTFQSGEKFSFTVKCS
ncbi:MAG: hypothetical protein JWM65_2838 [Sphingomonas bacterium]|nr:hypothetical protein [Sphingomonas bacterium]